MIMTTKSKSPEQWAAKLLFPNNVANALIPFIALVQSDIRTCEVEPLQEKLKTVSRLIEFADRVNQGESDQAVASEASFKEAVAYTTLEMVEAERGALKQRVKELEKENIQLKQDDRDVCHLMLCEAQHLHLKPSQLYWFSVKSDCQRCLQAERDAAITHTKDNG